jgi:hypothetical protein
MRSHLKVYFDFEIKAKELTEEEKGRLLLAMLRYAKDGTEPEMIGNERFLFPVFKEQIDEDIKAYETKVANGSRGGRPVMNREPEETEENRNKPEITEIAKKEERRKKKEEQEKEKEYIFDQFWAAYPRKEDKQRAKKEFFSLNPDECLLKTILTAIERWKATDQWTEDGGKYIPHPGTWLHNRRWEDEPPKASGKPYGKTVIAQQYEQRSYAGEQETADEMIERLMRENSGRICHEQI